MKTSDIVDVFVISITETIGEKWKHEVVILGSSSADVNFEIDGKEYVIRLFEVSDDSHWTEYLARKGERDGK